MQFPNQSVIIKIVDKLRGVTFPDHFGTGEEDVLEHLRIDLMRQIERSIGGDGQMARDITSRFLNQLDEVRGKLMRDARAGFDGDPAANSVDEIILSYPGMFAVFVYRFAHILYDEKVPFMPRMMTEYAHGQTGIDINPGAEIGENFFIDHGTGVVIGETCVIGNNVKLYQGVTLGALSTRGGQKLSGVRRHPTIENNVTIYAGTTILGGNTVIGANSVIGGNAFICESVPPNTKVVTNK